MEAAYLEQHQVINWMQEILEDLVKEQPGSPWQYIAQRAKQQEEEAQQKPLLEQLMKLEAEQEERRRELATLLENQGTRQNTPEEAERQHLMRENRQRLEELRFDQMILMEKQRDLEPEESDHPAEPASKARPDELVPFGRYYQRHILKALPSRLYDGFLPDSAAREAAAAALQVCHPMKLRDEDGDSSVAISASSRRGERRATPSGASGASGASARSSDSTAATMGGGSNRGPRVSVPKLVLPKRLQEASDSDRRPLDSRQRKTREALEKLTALYSVPISRSCPSLFSGKRAGPTSAAEKAEKPTADSPEKRPPRPPLPAPPKERLVNKATTEATRVRSEQALDKERNAQRRPDAKLQPLSSNRKKGFGPSLRDELRVREELGKLLSWSK